MKNTYGKKDLCVGDILVTKKGLEYCAVLDEQGNWAVVSLSAKDQKPFLANRFFFEKDGDIVIDRKLRDNGIVVKVLRYDTEPGVNRLSEALKRGAGMDACYRTTTVWSKDDPDSDILELVDKLTDARKKGMSGKEIRAFILASMDD